MEDRGFRLISKKELEEKLKRNPPHSPSLIEEFYKEGLAVMKLGDKMAEAIKQKYKKG